MDCNHLIVAALVQVVLAMMAAELVHWRLANAANVTACAQAAGPGLSLLSPQSCAGPLQSAACSLAEVLG